MKKHLTSAIPLLFFAISVPVFAAPATFQQAAKDYREGNFRLALSEFEQLKVSYPTNLQLHYYEALCYQGLGRLDQARVEYSYVANANSGSLKPMAQAALDQLSKAHGGGGGGGGGGGSTPSLPGRTAIASAASSTTSGEFKVRKVLEFYADW
jgi:tetratricopeptide (TPR) repeat protein